MASWELAAVDCSANSPPSRNIEIKPRLFMSRAPSKKLGPLSKEPCLACDGYHKKAHFDRNSSHTFIRCSLFVPSFRVTREPPSGPCGVHEVRDMTELNACECLSSD